MATKIAEGSKMGHNKQARVIQKPCPACHNMAGMVELQYPTRKANGAWGWRKLKTFAHVECLDKI